MAVFPTPIANVQSLDTFLTFRTRFNDCANLVNSVIPDTGIINIAGNATIGENLVVTGNLTVYGTTVNAYAQQLIIEDNIITLNSNTVGAPVLDAGIEVHRGSSANVYLIWDETADRFTVREWDGTDLSMEANTFVSTVPTGTAPFEVASTTRVNNLNVQYLNGHPETYYVANSYYQIFVANTNAWLANTNSWVTTVVSTQSSNLANTNSWHANTNAWITTVYNNQQSYLANTNTWIDSNLANTNSWILSLGANGTVYTTDGINAVGANGILVTTDGINAFGANGILVTTDGINVFASGGINVSASGVALDVASNRNVDHTSVSINSGAGLTGGGDITTTRTLVVGQANGIIVDSDSIQVKSANGILVTSDGINFRQTLSEQHTFSIQGAVTTGNTAPHFIMLGTGETINLIEFRHGLANTTGATTQANTALYINESPISGASQISNNDIRTVTLTPVSLSDDDKLWVKIDNELGSPANLSLTVRMERLKS